MTVGDNLYFFMERAQMGPVNLARATLELDKVGRPSRDGGRVFGVSQSAIWKLRSNARGALTGGPVLDLLARALGIGMSDLLRDNPTATYFAEQKRKAVKDKAAAARRKRQRLP